MTDSSESASLVANATNGPEDADFALDGIFYLISLMLGTGHYGVPIGRRIDHEADTYRDGIYICTRRNMKNWFCYNLPPPRQSGCIGQDTCLKCLSPFFADGTVQCIAAFNRDAAPWGVQYDLAEPTTGLPTITFLANDDVILISAVHEDQLLLRHDLRLQMTANGQGLPILGLVNDIPRILQAPRIVAQFDPAVLQLHVRAAALTQILHDTKKHNYTKIDCCSRQMRSQK